MGNKRSRAKTLALLCLMAHALFVCFTHFHDTGLSKPALPTASFKATGDGDHHPAPEANGDSHCLSCRLQRNFVSDAHNDSVVIASIEESLAGEIFLPIPKSRALCRSISARAPPLA